MTNQPGEIRVTADGVQVHLPAAPRGWFVIAYRYSGGSLACGISEQKLTYADGVLETRELNRQFPAVRHWLIPWTRSGAIPMLCLMQPLHHLN